MDNLFYTYDVANTTLDNAKEQSQAYEDSLIFHSPTYSIFAKGKEFGTYVLDVNHHYQQATPPTSPVGATTTALTLNATGTASTAIVGKIIFDEAGHITGANGITLSHGTAGTANSNNTYGAATSNLTIAANGTATTSIVGKVAADARGHVKTGNSVTLSHGAPSGGTADVITVSDVTVPSDGTNASLSYYAGVSKDANGHVTDKNSNTINIKHGDTLSGAITNKGQSSNVSMSYGTTFKVPYISVNKQGHVTSLTDYTLTSYYTDCQDGSVKHFKTVSELPNSPDSNTIYFVV